MRCGDMVLSKEFFKKNINTPIAPDHLCSGTKPGNHFSNLRKTEAEA